jgi:MFS family permease|tara:strand:- start:472 stop:1695 length:1224 start_codon:yes stop_codon:yes gene_type:complete
MSAKLTDDSQARRNVAVLVAAQAILGGQMPMMFIVAGLAGSMLSGNPCFATLPISLIVFGSMTTAPWLSPLMQKYGRKTGFFVGAIAGALGAAVSAYGLYIASFLIFSMGAYLSGIYMSAQGFYRFAATDTASDHFRPKAISYVMAGGLISAVLGPQLNKLVQDASVIPFLGSYIAMISLNLVGMFLFLLLRLPKGTASEAKIIAPTPPRSRKELLHDPKVLVAISCGMVAYSLMNLIMTSTPLAVVGCGLTKNNANDIVSAHVIAMFLPSFFTGHLIIRFGVERIMGLGLIILGGAGVVALSGMELPNFFVALMLLGLGWNFGFIGATTLLTSAHASHERGRVQGMNDAIVFGCVTIASIASGGLMNCAGGSVVQGWALVNYAMVPFLLLAGAALLWLVMINKRAA